MVFPSPDARSDAAEAAFAPLIAALRLADRSGAGLVGVVREAPDHALGEFVRLLHRHGLEGRVFLDPTELLLHVGAEVRVLRLRPEHAATTQPMRPSFGGLRLVLWIDGAIDFDVERAMPDFLDWGSHTARCPWQVPAFVEASLAGAKAAGRRVHWDGPPPSWRDQRGSARFDLAPWIEFGLDSRLLWAEADDPVQLEQARVYGSLLAHRADLLILRTPLPCPGWWRATEATVDLDATAPRLGAELAAMCGGEGDLLRLVEHGVALGLTVRELVDGERRAATPGEFVTSRVLDLVSVSVDDVVSGARHIPGLADDRGPTQLALRLWGLSEAARSHRSRVVAAVKAAWASGVDAPRAAAEEHAVWADPVDDEERLQVLALLLDRRERALPSAEWVGRWSGGRDAALAIRAFHGGDHIALASLRAATQGCGPWLGAIGRALREAGPGAALTLVGTPSGTPCPDQLAHLCRWGASAAWTADLDSVDRWLAVGLTFDDGTDPVLWAIAAHREHAQGRPMAAARALLHGLAAARPEHQEMLRASLRVALRRAGLGSEEPSSGSWLGSEGWRPDTTTVGSPAVARWLRGAPTPLLDDSVEASLHYWAFGVARAFELGQFEHARALAEAGVAADEGLSRVAHRSTVRAYPVSATDRAPPSHLLEYGAVAAVPFPIFHEVLAVLQARRGDHAGAASRLMAHRDDIPEPRRSTWDATIHEQLRAAGLLRPNLPGEPTIWDPEWEPRPLDPLPEADDDAARELILRLADPA